MLITLLRLAKRAVILARMLDVIEEVLKVVVSDEFISVVLASLKAEKPGYIGRITEIETTEGLADESQPVRRAKFYANLGLKEVDVPYKFPDSSLLSPPSTFRKRRLAEGIKGQLLLATFTDDAVKTKAVRSIIRRVYERGYNVDPQDEYIEKRLALISSDKGSRLKPLMVGSKSKSGRTPGSRASAAR